MIKEIHAKTLLSTCKNPSRWFGVKYNFNIFRGCQFQCIYCDSRSECYRIEDFNDIIVKINAADLLRKELSAKRKKGTLGTGAMSDPYMPVEKEYKLTRKCLEVILEFGYPVHIITKSNLILRDIDILGEINKVYSSVSITITTADDKLAGKIEPFAPSPTERLKALGALSAAGITTSITMMPILPFLEDTGDNIIEIVKKGHESGVKNIVPWMGMSLRDRQRAYYYKKLDEYFPGIRQKYERKFGSNYSCNANNSKKLTEIFNEACCKYGISTGMPSYESKNASVQLSILDGETFL